MKKLKLLYLIMFTFLIPACLFAETFSFDTFTFDSDDEGNVWTFLPTTLKNVKKGDVYNVKLSGIPSDDITLIDCGLEVETDGEWDFLGGAGAYNDLLDCFEKSGQELRPEIDNCFAKFNTKII